MQVVFYGNQINELILKKNLAVNKFLIALTGFLLVFPALAQNENTEGRRINIVYGGTFTKDEARLPGASIFSKDARQVQFEHQGADLWCDYALLYQQENRLEAIGNVRLEQGDSIVMTGGFIEYFGELKLAKSSKEVRLTNKTMTLDTDTLYLDREKQEAFYNHNGTIVDSINTLTSKVGRYDMVLKKYVFQDSVSILNPDYTVNSARLDYYTTTKKAYMYGPSTIVGEDYTLYCERGYYDTASESGFGIKNTEIHYDDRIIEGDSVYFNKAAEFASATNNIVITDTINKGVIRAHYAEVHKAKDSLFATKRAVSVSIIEQDSLYMHGDTLMVTGPPDARVFRTFRDARFYKKDLSGKADSIHFEEKNGITRLLKRPVLWNLENQMTGDSILLLSNQESEQLDSLKVLGNAFIISEDTLGHRGYNQAKGKNLFGKFKDNELQTADLIGNTEVVYYMYDDKDELMGINKTICSKIRLKIENSDIKEIIFYTNPDGTLYPEREFPEDSRLLEGFLWRGSERIFGPEDLFSAEDNNIELPVISGLTQAIDPNTLYEEEQVIPDIKNNPSKTVQKTKQTDIPVKNPTGNNTTPEPTKPVPANKKPQGTAKNSSATPKKQIGKKGTPDSKKPAPANKETQGTAKDSINQGDNETRQKRNQERAQSIANDSTITPKPKSKKDTNAAIEKAIPEERTLAEHHQTST